MRFGVPKQIKGIRPESWETAREAARRSGMSVAEWLDGIITDSAMESGVEPAHPAADGNHEAEPRQRLFRKPVDEYSEAEPASRRSHEPLDDDREAEPSSPRRRKYAGYDDRHRRLPDDAIIEVNERLDALSRQLEDQQRRVPEEFIGFSERLDQLRQELADERQRAPRQELAEFNERLDWLGRQLDQFARASAEAQEQAALTQASFAQQVAAPRETDNDDEVPRQLFDAISRLDERLDQLIEEGRTATTFIEQRVDAVDRAVAHLTRERPEPSLPNSTSPLDQALIEIAERQRTLEEVGGAPASYGSRTDVLPRAPTQGLSGLEQQLRQVTQRVETLHPCGLETAVETLRNDLAEIGMMLKEAMPRRAVEALESEVRALGQRIDDTRHSGIDTGALSGVERGLAEVRHALHALAPAESLVGLEESVNNLSQKIELVSAGTRDPVALEQLESAIVGLRGIVSHVASNDALAKLSDEVHDLANKVDRMAHSAGGADFLATLEDRITTIAEAMQARHHGGPDARAFEEVVHGLTDKLERLQLSRGDHAAVGHLEDRIVKLVEKLDASDARLNHLEAIERGLAELLIHLEHQRVPQASNGASSAEPVVVNSLKQDMARTQDSLEAVHGTLGHVVDRLALIETNLRRPSAAASPVPSYQAAMPPAGAELESLPQAATIAAAAPATASPAPARIRPATPPISKPSPSASMASSHSAPPTQANPAPLPEQERRPIDPTLPPDHPLEPGAVRGRGSSPSERIAASEAALGGTKPPVIPDPGGKSNFIAAARRAAQAASAGDAAKPERHAAVSPPAATAGAAGLSDRMKKHVRPLLVGTAVVIVVLGSLHLMNLLGSSDEAPGAAAPAPVAPASEAPRADAPESTPAPALQTAPPGRRSQLLPSSGAAAFGMPTDSLLYPIQPQRPAAEVPPSAAVVADTTGSITAPEPASAPAAADKIPAAIGGGLRAAAAKGDAPAQFELALRLAEGRGIPQNIADAAEWFDRAAKQGLVPAQFRLGGLYEKGIGVKKNLELARRLYTSAAEAGNAKAMHNLAVIYAEGIDGKPDYQTAAKWFRQAAEHGVADSEYNLGILYARGIGVETNQAEAYKWFALAAHEGDQEAVKKRDDVGTRLDAQSLAAATKAAQDFVPAPQPEAAVQVKVPSGGWDSVVAPSNAKRRAVGP